MAYRWPAGTAFKRITLDVEACWCPVCDRHMHVCDHRYHHLWTLEGPTQVVNRLVRCPDASCASRGRTFSPEAELSLSMPRWCIGWDVLCWLGHRRFARHWSVPQLRAELKDTHQIRLSDDAIEHYIGLYQTMLAARQQAPAQLAEAYLDIPSLVLTIDGLQPTERSQVDQRIGHQLHAIVPLLDTFKSEQQPLEFIFPGKGPLDTHPQGMDDGVEQPLAPALGVLAVAGVLCDVGDHPRIENALTIRSGVKAAVEIDISPSEVQADLFRHLLQGVQTLGQQDHVRLIDGGQKGGGQHVAIVAGHGDDLLPFLVLVG